MTLPSRALRKLTEIRHEIDRTVSDSTQRSSADTVNRIRYELESVLARAYADRRIASSSLNVSVDPFDPHTVSVSVYVKPIPVAPFIPIDILVHPYGYYDVRIETSRKP